MHFKKIAIIGGTGKSGTYLVNSLVEKGFELNLLVRTPNKYSISSTAIKVIEGDVRQLGAVRKLVKGCQAIISTLGQPKGESSIFSLATKNIVQVLQDYNLSRYIVTTGLNVNTPFDKKDDRIIYATEWMYENYPETTLDKQLEYDYLAQTSIDWTMVRLPLIVPTDKNYPTDVSLQNCNGEKISSLDLADFLIGQLSDSTYIKKCPFLFNI